MALTLTLCLLAVALNIADALLTDAVLRRGGVERNPVMRAIMAGPRVRPYRWAIKMAVVVGVLWLIVEGTSGTLRDVLLALWCAPFLWVVDHNYAALRRLKGRPLTRLHAALRRSGPDKKVL